VLSSRSARLIKTAPVSISKSGTSLRDIVIILLLVLLGTAPRFAFVVVFPTIPVSDFRSLVAFGLLLRSHGFMAPGWFWEYLNPGLPMCLAVLFRIAPSIQPDVLARMATAIACGLAPAIPFITWRGIMPLWVRFGAGATLALWPGQIVFSGVVAQDNWVLLPTVALGTLAVRSIYTFGHPVLASLFYVVAACVRQEMLIVLLPLLLVCVRVDLLPGRWRRLGTCVGIVVVAFLLFATQRFVATGRFALTTEHSGLSVLGSYVPGAVNSGWTDPHPFIASTHPELLQDRKALLSGTLALALREAAQRPGFHMIRILSTLLTFGAEGEVASLHWSIGAAETLPPALRNRGADLADRLTAILSVELAIIQGLFIAALLIGICKKNVAILILSCTVLLKYAVHGVTVAQGRYFIPVTALQLLAIVLACWEIRESWPPNGRLISISVSAAALTAILLLCGAPRLKAAVERWEREQRHRFVLTSLDGGVALACVVEHGRVLVAGAPRMASIQLSEVTASPGDVVTADCGLTVSERPQSIVLRLSDNYAPGGFPGRILQRVYLDDRVVYVHDIGQEPGTGWTEVQLGTAVPGTKRSVRVQIEAIQPDRGWGWGNASLTELQLSSDEK
jgi:hypothetical protein